MNRSGETGFTMIEVLVAIVVILLGLLGLAGLQTRLYQAEFESYQRSQALVLLHDMVERINLHRDTAPCFAITAAAGAPTYGTGTADSALTCALSGEPSKDAATQASMREWNQLLLGASEKSAGDVAIGAMVGARGCVYYDDASVLPLPGGGGGTGVFTVAVSWQGTVAAAVPAVTCGVNQYGGAAEDSRRRTISTTFRLAQLK